MAGRRTTGPYGDPTLPPAGASPYGFQGGSNSPPQQQPPPQPAQRRPSAAEQQELRWMQEQQEAEEYATQQRSSQHGQHDPYLAYPHEAPAPSQQPPLHGESPTARLTGEDEFFDPYAPSAAKAHRRTSSGTGEFMYPPVYRVRIDTWLTCSWPLQM
jgi:hypothetical protein